MYSVVMVSNLLLYHHVLFSFLTEWWHYPQIVRSNCACLFRCSLHKRVEHDHDISHLISLSSNSIYKCMHKALTVRIGADPTQGHDKDTELAVRYRFLLTMVII